MPTSKDTKTMPEVPKKEKTIKNCRHGCFTILHYNMFKSKITQKSYCLLNLKLIVGQKIDQTSCKFYLT